MRSKNTLINFYKTAWPEQEMILHEQLRSSEDRQQLIQFKKYIENYSHKNRYSYISLTPAFYYFPGSWIVYPSAEFRRLVSVVDQCLERLNKKEEINYLNLLQQLISAIFLHPYESLFFFTGLMLIARVGGTKQDDFKPFFHPYNRYRSIPMEDIRSKRITCERKPAGASIGKYCYIDEIPYYMKEVLPSLKNQGNNQVMAAFNNLFLSRNIGIEVSPETAFLCMGKKKVKCYFSSKKVDNFVEAITLCLSQKGIWCKFNPQTIKDKIGEKSIAQLAVANTFIKDLHAKNWGYRTTIDTPDQNRLVILDTDQAPKRQLKKHIEFVHKQFSEQKFGIPLHLVDILYMKNIYLAMQKIPVTTFHKSVDMSPKMYQTLLMIFIEACDKIILADKSGGSPNCESYNSDFANYVYEIGMRYSNDYREEDSYKEDPSEDVPDKTEEKVYHYKW